MVSVGVTRSALALDSLLALHDPADYREEPALVLTAQAFLANDVLSTDRYSGDWQGRYRPRNGNNIGVLSGREDVSVKMSGWEFGRLSRQEAFIRMNLDTSNLLRDYKTKTPVTVGSLAIDASYYAVAMMGWRIGRAWEWGEDSTRKVVGVAWSSISASRGRIGNVSGQFEALGGSNYRYRLNYIDSWDKKIDYFQTSGSPYAHGSALDIGASWQTPGLSKWSVVVNDLFGRLNWQNLPSAVSNLQNSGITTTDANGYINYLPAVAGRIQSRNLVERLPVRWALGAETPWLGLVWLASLSHENSTQLPLVGVQRELQANWRIQADYDIRFSSMGIRVSKDQCFMALRSSSLRREETSAYGISVGLNVAF